MLPLCGITKEDYQRPGRCRNIPSVINKMIHNAAHGATFYDSFISSCFIGLFAVKSGGKWTHTHKHTYVLTKHRYVCGFVTVGYRLFVIDFIGSHVALINTITTKSSFMGS